MAIEHMTVYKGTEFHSSFPNIVRLKNGELLCAFRQAPVRPGTGVPGHPNEYYYRANELVAYYHRDADSRIVVVRSRDSGRTWAPDSLTVVAQSDGTVDLNLTAIGQVSSGQVVVNGMRILASQTSEQVAARMGRRYHMPLSPTFRLPPLFEAMVFDTLYLVRSADGGHNWGVLEPIGVPSLNFYSHTGQTGVLEMPDGSWLLPFHGRCRADPQDRIYLMRSTDAGRHWGKATTMAHDPEGKLGFHEPPLLRLRSGRLLAVTRTSLRAHLYQAFSDDDGWTWQGHRRTPIWGYPSHLLQLRSGRVLCTYGYRREPFGIRSCLSDDEGESWDVQHEIVIRDDGTHRDLGYPASVQLDDDRILSVYYFHGQDGVRYIGGSVYSEEDAFR